MSASDPNSTIKRTENRVRGSADKACQNSKTHAPIKTMEWGQKSETAKRRVTSLIRLGFAMLLVSWACVLWEWVAGEPRRNVEYAMIIATICSATMIMAAIACSHWARLDGASIAFMTPNDSSSATRPTGGVDCNLDAMAGFAAAHG